MAETWPAINHYAKQGTFRVDQPFRKPHKTDMDSGPVRRRRSSSKNIATVSFSIQLTPAEYQTFQAWVRDTLVDGSLEFTMPIFDGTTYTTKTCSIPDGLYKNEAGTGFMHEISWTLDVENY